MHVCCAVAETRLGFRDAFICSLYPVMQCVHCENGHRFCRLCIGEYAIRYPSVRWYVDAFDDEFDDEEDTNWSSGFFSFSFDPWSWLRNVARFFLPAWVDYDRNGEPARQIRLRRAAAYQYIRSVVKVRGQGGRRSAPCSGLSPPAIV